jgi:hypothetical protein
MTTVTVTGIPGISVSRVTSSGAAAVEKSVACVTSSDRVSSGTTTIVEVAAICGSVETSTTVTGVDDPDKRAINKEIFTIRPVKNSIHIRPYTQTTLLSIESGDIAWEKGDKYFPTCITIWLASVPLLRK